MLEGVDVFRINFSHADYDNVKERIKIIRALNKKHNIHTSILADLQGPKLRVGEIEEGTESAQEGDTIAFSAKTPLWRNGTKAYMNYKKLQKDVQAGERILLDDGKLIFEVVSTDKKTEVVTKVIQGGAFKSKKGVSLPNTAISLPALTEKDIKDAHFAIQQNVDWIALSFVRNNQDLLDLKAIIDAEASHKIPIISKNRKARGHYQFGQNYCLQ